MGHERLGILPKTKPWKRIVDELAGSDLPEEKIEKVASQTIQNVRSRFSQISEDPGVITAFKCLVALSVSAQFTNPFEFLSDSGIEIGTNASPYYLAKAISKFVSTHMDSREYGEIALSATVDAISAWHEKNRQQLSLFESDNTSFDTWRGTSNGAGFCEISRLFFAKTVERYMNYFLERVLSSSAKSITERDALNKRLREHVEVTSQHAFETAKITQSFAAGWFNKYANKTLPIDEDIKNFLRIAFGKLREELWREEKA